MFLDESGKRGVQVGWRYYNDGKAWLAKGLCMRIGARGGQKELTAFWLSVWDGFFRITIFVPEKARPEAACLPLSDGTREMVEGAKQMGKPKFFPLAFDVCSDAQFDDIFALVGLR